MHLLVASDPAVWIGLPDKEDPPLASIDDRISFRDLLGQLSRTSILAFPLFSDGVFSQIHSLEADLLIETSQENLL